MKEEVSKTLEHCIDYATDLLLETGEAYPFGAFIDTVGNVHPLEMEIDNKNVPNIGQVVESLSKYCEEEMAAERMRGYALCYEVEYRLSEEDEPSDAIAIDIKHVEDSVDIYFLPFNKSDQMDVGKLFAVQRS